MVKNEGLLIAGAIIVAVLLLNQQQQAPPIILPPSGGGGGGNTGGGVDLCKLVDGQASFTGQRMFLSGTNLQTDWVRVIEMNGDNKRDLGQISLNSGTISVNPGKQYKLYYGENTSSDTRYTTIESYTAPCQDATDNKVGIECNVDGAPTITIYNSDGQVLTNGSNVEQIDQDETTDVEVKIKAAADSCIGNPQAVDFGKKNALCFHYNSTTYESVKANTPVSAVPYSIGNEQTTGFSTSCYQFDLLKDTESQLIKVTLKPASGKNPAANSADNITIKMEDVDFDLDQNTLAEIMDFQDESNNNLGKTTISGSHARISVS